MLGLQALFAEAANDLMNIANKALFETGKLLAMYYKYIDFGHFVSAETSPNLCTIILRGNSEFKLFQSLTVDPGGGKESEDIALLLRYFHALGVMDKHTQDIDNQNVSKLALQCKEEFDNVFVFVEKKQMYYHPHVILYAIQRAVLDMMKAYIGGRVDKGDFPKESSTTLLRNIYTLLEQSVTFKINFYEDKKEDIVKFEIYR